MMAQMRHGLLLYTTVTTHWQETASLRNLTVLLCLKQKKLIFLKEGKESFEIIRLWVPIILNIMGTWKKLSKKQMQQLSLISNSSTIFTWKHAVLNASLMGKSTNYLDTSSVMPSSFWVFGGFKCTGFHSVIDSISFGFFKSNDPSRNKWFVLIVELTA